MFFARLFFNNFLHYSVNYFKKKKIHKLFPAPFLHGSPSLPRLLDHSSTTIHGINCFAFLAPAPPSFGILLSKNGERRGKRQTEKGGSASAELCDTVTDTFTVEQDKRVCERASDRHSGRGDKIEIRALA